MVSFLTGEPEYLDPLKDEAPEGWIVTGYPWSTLHTPAHDAFLKAYEDRYHDHPRLGSVVGYTEIEAAAGILRKAHSTDPEAIVTAAEGLRPSTRPSVRRRSAPSTTNRPSAPSWAPRP